MVMWVYSGNAKVTSMLKINHSICHFNRIKMKNYMSIPTEAEKVFDKIQYPLTIENLSGQEIENNFAKCV